MMHKIQVTQQQYDAIVARWKKDYGPNILDWPFGLRQHYRMLDIIPEVTVKLVQGTIYPPFSNRGVDENEY